MLHEFVIDLPEGYGTTLGSEDHSEGGVQLSGGQMLMLAGARLRNPPILILGKLFFFVRLLVLLFPR